MGCADYKFGNYGSEIQYQNTLKLVSYWRECFFDKIFQSKYRIDLRSTCIFTQRQSDVTELLDICVKELTNLMNSDSDTADYKKKNKWS